MVGVPLLVFHIHEVAFLKQALFSIMRNELKGVVKVAAWEFNHLKSAN